MENTEPNWTELLEREYKEDRVYWPLVELWRKQGDLDKKIYQLLASFG